MPVLSVKIGRMTLKNPVMPASGTFGYGEEYSKLIDLNKLGAIVTKCVRLKPTLGNPPPRLAETPCGLIASVGLQSIGVEAFIKEKMPFLRRFNTRIIANIGGETVEEYVEIAERLNGVKGLDGLEVNVSCPNIKRGGIAFGVDPETVYKVVSQVRKAAKNLTLIVKLTPNVTNIVEIAEACEQAGAEALTLINSPLGMAVDIEKRKPKLSTVLGGLCGPAIKPIGLRCVWQVAQRVRIPIIGVGGIFTATDALEYIIAGATAVQVGTANFVKPRVMLEIIEGIEKYLEEHEIDNINKLIGSLQV